MIMFWCIILHGRTFFWKSSVSHGWSRFGTLFYKNVHFFCNLLCLVHDGVMILYCTWTNTSLKKYSVSQMIVFSCIIVHERIFFLISSVAHRWSCFHTSLDMNVHFSDSLACLILDRVMIYYCTWPYISLKNFCVS